MYLQNKWRQNQQDMVFITFCVVPKYVYTHTPIHLHTYMYLGNHIISAHSNLSPLNW